jgi:hypothetical protein
MKRFLFFASVAGEALRRDLGISRSSFRALMIAVEAVLRADKGL